MPSSLLLAVEVRREERTELHQVPVMHCWGEPGAGPQGSWLVWAGCGCCCCLQQRHPILSKRKECPVVICSPSSAIPSQWLCPRLRTSLPGLNAPGSPLCSPERVQMQRLAEENHILLQEQLPWVGKEHICAPA